MTLPVLRESADAIRLFDPSSGEEIVPADATTDKLAEIRDALRDYDETAKMAKKAIDAEILERMDRAGKWTAEVGRFRLTAPSPAPETVYDAEALHEALSSLVDEGVIDASALMDAVSVEQVFRAQRAGINRLLKLGGRVRDAIVGCGEEREKDRRVSVKRA